MSAPSEIVMSHWNAGGALCEPAADGPNLCAICGLALGPKEPLTMSKRIDFPVPRQVIRTMTTHCKSCGAHIVYQGKQPLDCDSAIEDPADPENTARLESHFAHCPYASRHRKPKTQASSEIDGYYRKPKGPTP